MKPQNFNRNLAIAANFRFERIMRRFLLAWIHTHRENSLLKFNQPMDVYLENDLLRDFFLNSPHPMQSLLKNAAIAAHLGRAEHEVYFDQESGDPLFSKIEQRIYNLARRMDSEKMHVPFRSIHPNKQTEAGDNLAIEHYPEDSLEIRYNSGNHFASQPANEHVFNENSINCRARSGNHIHVLFKVGFLEDRLQEVKLIMTDLAQNGEKQLQFFVICSRHSPVEGHFGVSLLVMSPANPEFPLRILICDTLLKDLPQHPRWWYHFVAEYAQVFGAAVSEMIEDLSHPLQKVNIKGDHPYRHDWDCPYYTTIMTHALISLLENDPEVILSGNTEAVHHAMKKWMMDYYRPDGELKERCEIRQVNRSKRWKSGSVAIKNLWVEAESSYQS